jgi:ankyrin repeat/BTB/POZ domain-containing protein 1
LLAYDYSKSTDPLQPFAAHITSLLTRDHPKTSDIVLTTGIQQFELHKLVLAARSPYFAKKFATAPETLTWKLPNTIPPDSLQAAIKFMYFGEVGADFEDQGNEEEILTGIDKLSRHIEIPQLFESILVSDNRRIARQRRADEVARGRDQIETWFKDHILKHKITVDTEKAGEVRWDRNNGIFADVLLRADEDDEGEANSKAVEDGASTPSGTLRPTDGIPIGPFGRPSRSPSRTRKSRKSVLFPAHRAMLIRSELFNTMFSSSFREAQETPYLQIVPVDCPPDVLEIVLTYLYTEKADFPLELAIEVLFAADLLFIDKLKGKAAQFISTLGNGMASIVESENPRGEIELEDIIDIYDVIRAGWDTRVQRLEEFGARYIAYRLERYIDESEFLKLVRESAGRVKERQETDTIELIDE